jgi:MazG family protein
MSSFFDQLRSKVRAMLNDKQGCAWLQEQDWRSIANYSLEEVYELIDAIESDDLSAITDELSDFCFHLVIYTEMKHLGHQVTLDDVAKRALQKLDERGLSLSEKGSDSAQARHQHWQETKLKKRLRTSGSLIDSIPQNLPSLLQSQKLLQALEPCGFKFDDMSLARLKMDEEIKELDCALEKDDRAAIEEELGDVLFACVALAQELSINSAQALRRTNQKFKDRIQTLEQLVLADGKDMLSLDKEELSLYYQQSKTKTDS